MTIEINKGYIAIANFDSFNVDIGKSERFYKGDKVLIPKIIDKKNNKVTFLWNNIGTFGYTASLKAFIRKTRQIK